MQAHANIVKKFPLPNWILGVAGALWLVMLTIGLRAMVNYEDGPGLAAEAPSQWPKDSRLARELGMPALVLFVHPKCPCSDATIGELSILMTRLQHKISTTVIFVRPANLPEGWEQTPLWRKAQEIPGVKVVSDPAGVEAKRFGAQASGQAMLYDSAGRLKFAGGITASRGHSGDNAGRSAIVSLVTTGAALTDRTSVYGCSLDDPSTRARKGE
jgi:hypothetical protein